MHQPIDGLGVDEGAASASTDFTSDNQSDSLILVTKGSEWSLREKRWRMDLDGEECKD